MGYRVVRDRCEKVWEESGTQVLACPGRRNQELVTVPGSQPVPTWAQEAGMGTDGVRSTYAAPSSHSLG